MIERVELTAKDLTNLGMSPNGFRVEWLGERRTGKILKISGTCGFSPLCEVPIVIYYNSETGEFTPAKCPRQRNRGSGNCYLKRTNQRQM